MAETMRRYPRLGGWVVMDNWPLRDRDDQRSGADLPVIHHTVVERITADPEYRPKSLQNARYRVLEKDGSLRDAAGLDEQLPSSERR